MNKSRNAIPLGSLPPKLRAQAEAQLGLQAQPVEQPKTPRALQPMKEKRIRQSSKPLMNKLESAFLDHLRSILGPEVKIHCQAKNYKLCNGVNYRPDFTAILSGGEWAWEVKGDKIFDGSIEKLKMAASVFTDTKWVLAWRESGSWKTQEVFA